jgi:peptide/nickel transport system permease protein
MILTIVRRFVRAFITLFGVLTFSFILIRLGGNPGLLLLGPTADPATVKAINEKYGLNDSVWVQFWRFLRNASHGDLGNSIVQGQSALHLVLGRLSVTLQLAFLSFAFGLVLAFGFSLTVQILYANRLRNALLWFGALVQAIPTFLLGIILVLVFAVEWRLLPALGQGGIKHLILPVLSLGLFEFALYLRLFNVAFDEEATKDYMRTAYATGQRRSSVIVRHSLPNAVLPLLTVAGLNLGNLIAGTVIVETIFALPGDGALVNNAINARDYPMVQAGIIVFAVFVIAINVVVDVLYVFLDPRVRSS